MQMRQGGLREFIGSETHLDRLISRPGHNPGIAACIAQIRPYPSLALTLAMPTQDAQLGMEPSSDHPIGPD